MRLLLICFLVFLITLSTSAQDNLLEVNVSNPQPYAGEVFTYSIKFTSSFDLSETQIQLPPFIGFAQEPQSPTLSTISQNSVILNVIQQDVLLYANQIGEINIDETIITVPESPFQSGIEVTSEIEALTIQSLPDNPPQTFTGGVGQFDMTVTINPPTVQAGEPNLLNIAITGSGNFSQIASPSLRLPNTWDVFEQPSSTASIGNNLQTKTFGYQFFADQTGAIDIPAVLFTFFDPVSESYRTLTAEAGNITIEGEFASSQSGDTSQDSNRLALKPMTDQPDKILPTDNFWILWSVAPLIALLVTISRLIVRPRQSNTRRTTRKQSKALSIALEQLKLAQNAESNQAYTIVEQTIFTYLSAKYKQDIVPHDLPDLIVNLSANLQQRITVCVEQAQAGQYAPLSKHEAEQLIRRTYKTLLLVEKERT